MIFIFIKAILIFEISKFRNIDLLRSVVPNINLHPKILEIN